MKALAEHLTITAGAPEGRLCLECFDSEIDEPASWTVTDIDDENPSKRRFDKENEFYLCHYHADAARIFLNTLGSAI